MLTYVKHLLNLWILTQWDIPTVESAGNATETIETDTVDIVSLSLRLSLLLLLLLLLLTSLSLLQCSVGLPVSAVHSLSRSLLSAPLFVMLCVCVCVCLWGIEMRVQLLLLLLLLFLLHCCTSCTSSLDRKMFCSQNVQRQTNFHCCRRQFCCDDACIKYVHVSLKPKTHTRTHTSKQTMYVCPLRAFI